MCEETELYLHQIFTFYFPKVTSFFLFPTILNKYKFEEEKKGSKGLSNLPMMLSVSLAFKCGSLVASKVTKHWDGMTVSPIHRPYGRYTVFIQF